MIQSVRMHFSYKPILNAHFWKGFLLTIFQYFLITINLFCHFVLPFILYPYSFRNRAKMFNANFSISYRERTPE